MKNYIDSQIDKIVTPNQNHIAGRLKIKGDCGGETNWLNISADQLEAIRIILDTMSSHN